MLPNPNYHVQHARVPVGDKVDVVFENPNIKFNDLVFEGYMAPYRRHGRQQGQRFHLSIKIRKLK